MLELLDYKYCPPLPHSHTEPLMQNCGQYPPISIRYTDEFPIPARMYFLYTKYLLTGNADDYVKVILAGQVLGYPVNWNQFLREVNAITS